MQLMLLDGKQTILSKEQRASFSAVELLHQWFSDLGLGEGK